MPAELFQIATQHGRRFGKTELTARQVSQRTGDLTCKLLGDRVEIAGEAVLYLRGEIEI